MTYLILFATAITFAGLFIDAYFHPGALLRYAGIDSKVILYVFALILLIFRLLGKRTLPESILRLNRKVIFLILTVVSLLFILLENINYETYVLGTFGFHYDQFLIMAGFSGYIIYINRNIQNYKPYQLILHYAAPLFLFAVVLIHIADIQLFLTITKEDHLFEYFQYFAFLAASILAIITAKLTYRKQRLLAIFSVLLGLGLFFVAGEEISWGQRIIGIETPKALRDINYQDELTVHNIMPIQRLMHFVYMAIGVWGVLGYYIVRRLKFIPNNLKPYLAPKPYLILYFLAVGVFFTFSEYVLWYYEIETAAKTGVHRWQEVSEVFVALGFLIFTRDNYKRVRIKNSKFQNY